MGFSRQGRALPAVSRLAAAAACGSGTAGDGRSLAEASERFADGQAS